MISGVGIGIAKSSFGLALIAFLEKSPSIVCPNTIAWVEVGTYWVFEIMLR